MTLGNQLLPNDIGLAWSGVSYQEAQESQKGTGIYLIVLLFVFLALASLYESWGLPIAILAGVPIAVLGVVLFIGIAHLVNPIFINDLYLQISLVMLVGLSAKNAILVVEYANRLLYERGANLLDATLEAARLRLRPILMTAFSFILGVVPLVFASGVYSTARNIMGLALVGGMLLTTIIGIFLYPALYYLIARLGRFEERRAKQHA
ncbi:MAG: efflux RND transporter permease subunit, partial [Alistipes sp.]|nr:efflux RND transporter permease subunit [Alistipes sp.]